MNFFSNLKLKYKVILIAVIPVLTMCVIALIINNTVVKEKLLDDTKSELRATAKSLMAAYDQNQGDYFVNSAGDVWKGSYNVSLSENFIDDLSEKTGIEFTFFYGDRRLVTSLADEKGNKIKGTPAGDFIVENVLNDGNDVFTNRVQVEDEMYFGYYIPVLQESNGEIIGMVFAGKPVSKVEASVNFVTRVFIVAIAAIIVMTVIVCILGARSISKSIQKSIEIVEQIADGNLNVDIDKKSIGRKDEVGNLSKSTAGLKENLLDMIGSISDSAKQLSDSSTRLASGSENTVTYISQVEYAINEIAAGATKQAQDTLNATDEMEKLGYIVGDTSNAAKDLENSANNMNRTSNDAVKILSELRIINDKTRNAFNEYEEQAKATNDSISNIQSFANVITNIADQTALLALNASIEAARAGETGRGFAVVAGEISSLAKQSSDAASETTRIIEELILNSQNSVKTMEEVTSIIRQQDNYIKNTEKAFDDVKKEVDTSLSDIKYISEKIDEIVGIRNHICDVLEKLSDVAGQNAASSQENSALVTEVTVIMNDVAKEVDNIKEIVESLNSGIEKFSL